MELDLTYHQIVIEEFNMDGMVDASLAIHNGLVGVELGRAVVLTGVHTGSVVVTVELFESEPALGELDAWDEIVDVTLDSPRGQLVIHGLMSDIPEELPILSHHGPGIYRLRVYARGRDQAINSTDETIECYRFEIWPSHALPELIHKQSDNYGSEVRSRGS